MFGELIEYLKKLNLPTGKYAVFGSGPIAVRELTDAHDIDVIVTADVCHEYKTHYQWKEKPCNNDFYLRNEGIELWKTWGPGQWDIQQLIDSAEIINGIPYVQIETVLEWKKLNGRPKDLEHIRIIENYLGNNLDSKVE